MNEATITITHENAQQVLIDESYQRPVVIDFWADWCAPCKVLMPILEKLANEYQGQFVLAKVNADEHQNIASQFSVRSLPTVVIMREGQPVDAFTGAQPEGTIRQILEKHLPAPWDALVADGLAKLEAGDFSAALSPLKQAYEQSGQRTDIALPYAQALLELRRGDEAEVILTAVPYLEQDHHHQQLVAQLELLRQAAKAPEIEALEQRHAAEPENLDVAYQLAMQYSQHQHHREALDMLLNILQRDREHADGAVRKTMLDVIKSLGKGDPLAAEYQRKLFGLLY